MRKARVYHKVTNMREMKERKNVVYLNNVISYISNHRVEVVRNNKFITKDGDVRNFSSVNYNN